MSYTKPTAYPRTATIFRVVDGDTLHITADIGCDLTVAMTVRLYGINCPELATDEGKVAKAFVTQWVAVHGPTFELRTVKDKREKFGRYLVDLVPLHGGASLCEALLATDNAVYYLP